MFSNRISQTLHDEHCATVALMEGLDKLIGSHRRSIPDAADAAVRRFLGDLARDIASDIDRHFAFEEGSLFTYLEAMGDGAIGEHLTSEHEAMRPLGRQLVGLAKGAIERGFDQATWDEFRRAGQELCDRMLAHVQKEEMALLPILEDVLDGDTEAQLFEKYQAM